MPNTLPKTLCESERVKSEKRKRITNKKQGRPFIEVIPIIFALLDWTKTSKWLVNKINNIYVDFGTERNFYGTL